MILFFVILLVYESRNLVFFSDAHYRMQGNIIGGVKGSIKDHRWQVSIQYHHDIKERNSELKGYPDHFEIRSRIGHFDPDPGICGRGSVSVDPWPVK